MDSQLVEDLNRWFTGSAFRADLCRALAIAPVMLIGVLVVLAWSTPRSNSPIERSELLLGVVAGVGALLLNLAVGHLYYRARPFLVLDVRPLLPEAVDSSLFSDHLAVAGAAAASLVVARRTFGWVALGLGVLLAVGRIGAGVPYPSDCVVGAAVGAGCFLVLLPLRGPVSRAIAAAYPRTGSPETKAEHAFTHRHRRGSRSPSRSCSWGLATASASSSTTGGSQPRSGRKGYSTRAPDRSHQANTRRSPSRRSLRARAVEPTRPSSGT